MKPHLWFIHTVSRIVPRRFRSEWQQEWEAELGHRESLLQRWRQMDGKASRDLFRRSAGAFWDALAMQPRRLEEEMFQDLRYGVRMLLKNRSLTAVAVLSLALGIGANTAVFSLVDAMLLRMLPVAKPSELVLFAWTSKTDLDVSVDGDSSMRPDPVTGLQTSNSFSTHIYEEIRAANQTLSDIFAFARLYQLNIAADNHAEIGNGQLVSGNYFSALGLRTAAGRAIVPDDDRAGSNPVAMIGYRYWQGRFGQDPALIGKTLTVNNVHVTIVGITPPDFSGTLQIDDSPDIYLPMAFEPQLRPGNPTLNNREIWWLQMMGRLKSGVTAEQVGSNFQNVFQQTARDDFKALRLSFPEEMPSLEIASGSRALGDVRTRYSEPLMVLTVILVLILLIAVANVANLLLARAAARQREIATRLAIGATRLRLVRQLVTEGLVLSILGGMLGVPFAYWGKDLLVAWGPWGTRPEGIAARIDLRIFVFTIVVSLLTALLFALAPALRAVRLEINPAMTERARTFSTGRSRFGKSLLVLQIAMSVVLLIGAGFFVRTLRNLYRVDAGFDTQNLLLFRVDPRLNNYKPEQALNLLEQVVERIQGIPGVQAATFASQSLVGGGANRMSTTGKDGTRLEGSFVWVRSNFFDTLRLPIVAGRSFSPQDDRKRLGLIIVNETFVRRNFPDGNALGKRLADFEIIGVVRDAKYRNLREDIPPTVYVQGQGLANRVTFQVRAGGDVTALIPFVREAVRQIDSNLPIWDVKTQHEQIDQTLRQEYLFANFSSAFGLVAALLVSVGLYGLMSYNVVRRTHEIGIRMALGAQRVRIFGLVMRESLFLALAGVLIGLVAGLGLIRTLTSMLYGLTPHDPLTITIAVTFIVIIAAIAGYLPARRAARVDPMVALRYE
jgi:predicted permease